MRLGAMLFSLIPAQAGIQADRTDSAVARWVPAFAGTSGIGATVSSETQTVQFKFQVKVPILLPMLEPVKPLSCSLFVQL